MSMTRAEAIDWFEQVRDIAKRNLGEKWTRGCEKHYQLKVDLAEAALTALRFPTREMVERMRGEWLNFYNDFSTAECSKCEELFDVSDADENIKVLFDAFKKYYRFCPACGAPMTDEAVQMVMERMEALKDGA